MAPHLTSSHLIPSGRWNISTCRHFHVQPAASCGATKPQISRNSPETSQGIPHEMTPLPAPQSQFSSLYGDCALLRKPVSLRVHFFSLYFALIEFEIKHFFIHINSIRAVCLWMESTVPGLSQDMILVGFIEFMRTKLLSSRSSIPRVLLGAELHPAGWTVTHGAALLRHAATRHPPSHSHLFPSLPRSPALSPRYWICVSLIHGNDRDAFNYRRQLISWSFADKLCPLFYDLIIERARMGCRQDPGGVRRR